MISFFLGGGGGGEGQKHLGPCYFVGAQVFVCLFCFTFSMNIVGAHGEHWEFVGDVPPRPSPLRPCQGTKTKKMPDCLDGTIFEKSIPVNRQEVKICNHNHVLQRLLEYLQQAIFKLNMYCIWICAGSHAGKQAHVPKVKLASNGFILPKWQKHKH